MLIGRPPAVLAWMVFAVQSADIFSAWQIQPQQTMSAFAISARSEQSTRACAAREGEADDSTRGCDLHLRVKAASPFKTPEFIGWSSSESHPVKAAVAGRSERKEWHSWVLRCIDKDTDANANANARQWLVSDRSLACVEDSRVQSLLADHGPFPQRSVDRMGNRATASG
jgi:hypothetical protein